MTDQTFETIDTQVYGGRVVNLLNPTVNDINLENIAFSLSKQCRFNGNCKEFYSVAQHSVNVARLIESPEAKIYGLLHDCHEAFIGDISTPVKNLLKAKGGTLIKKIWDEVTGSFDAVIYEACGLDFPSEDILEQVSSADREALYYEAENNMWPCKYWGEADGLYFRALEPSKAFRLFMEEYHKLIGEYNGSKR